MNNYDYILHGLIEAQRATTSTLNSLGASLTAMVQTLQELKNKIAPLEAQVNILQYRIKELERPNNGHE